MALKKFGREGPSMSQFGELVLAFVGMLIFKIIVFIILRWAYRSLVTLFHPYFNFKKTEDETKDKKKFPGNNCNLNPKLMMDQQEHDKRLAELKNKKVLKKMVDLLKEKKLQQQQQQQQKTPDLLQEKESQQQQQTPSKQGQII